MGKHNDNAAEYELPSNYAFPSTYIDGTTAAGQRELETGAKMGGLLKNLYGRKYGFRHGFADGEVRGADEEVARPFVLLHLRGESESD